MQINVSFENLTEMREFAAMIMGASGSQKKTAVADKPAPQPIYTSTGCPGHKCSDSRTSAAASGQCASGTDSGTSPERSTDIRRILHTG